MRTALAITTTVLLSALLAGSAWAENVAGWDFSQYSRDGDSSGSVSANYSSLDPTGNAGAESAAYGTATMSGVVARHGDLSPGVVPSGSLTDANIGGPASGLISNSFNAFTTLQLEGQTFTNPMSITAPAAPGTAVFEGDLTSLADTTGYGWSVSFAGKVVGDSSASVGVEFADDCSTYSSAGNVIVDDETEAYTVEFPKIASPNACARLTIPQTAGSRTVIDNVSLDVIAVPEPAVGAQLLAGFMGLVALARRRR